MTPRRFTLLAGLLVASLFILVMYVIPFFYKTFTLEISPTEARAKRFHLVIDVRTPQERDEWGYYPNSIPISMNQLATKVPFALTTKHADLLVYANSDARAAIAAETLYDMGYHSVRYLKGSYLDLLPPGQNHRRP